MEMHERATLGPLIRAAREGRGWSQEELATRAATTRRTVGSIERGDTTGQKKVLQRVLDALGVVDGLVTEPDVKTFVKTITPLLQRLTEEERARVMPAIVHLVADALAQHAAPSNVDDLAAKRARRQAIESDRIPTMEELENEPSAAFPLRDDVEGTEEPEGP
jgi:transcriptional regulator with XRE-family HTH domain